LPENPTRFHTQSNTCLTVQAGQLLGLKLGKTIIKTKRSTIMRAKHIPLTPPHTLVENRVSFAGPDTELSIYDTYLPVNNVALSSDELLYCGMIQGRKIMHNESNSSVKSAFNTEFLPHESFVMAPGTVVEIDFPEAAKAKPTRCLTVEISRDRVSDLAKQLLKQKALPEELEQWHSLTQQILHTPHTEGTQHLLERLFTTFTQADHERDLAIHFGISELVTRLLRHQGRMFLLENARKNPELTGLHAALNWIEENISEPLNIDKLCQLACMSRSKFYSSFKRQLGCSPAELQQQLRLKEAAALLSIGKSVTEACFTVGYSSLSHFTRRFQQQFGCAPRQYMRTDTNNSVESA
jgi:AraC-like DNA-binding protein